MGMHRNGLGLLALLLSGSRLISGSPDRYHRRVPGPPSETTTIETTVAILGAGWAGVSAGNELNKEGLNDFVIVEGGSHIGGRSRKVNFGEKEDGGQYVVEDGSNWIQGIGNSKKADANPIWELAEKYGLSKIKKKKHPFKNVGEGSIQQDYCSYAVYDVNGYPVADIPGDIRWDDMEYAYDCVKEKSIKNSLAFWMDGTLLDQTCSQRTLFEECGWFPVTPMDELIEWWDMDWEWGHNPDDGNCYDPVWGYEDFDEEDEFIIDQRGFQYLAERLVGEYFDSDEDQVISDERLLLNTIVTEIDYEPKNCPDGFDNGCVEITTDQNIKIIAQYAIVTFSSAVVFKGNDQGRMFSPKLPDTNRDALASLKRGIYTKVYFQFPYKFWDDVEFILTANEERGASSLWQNLDMFKLLPGSHIIFQTLTAELGIRAEEVGEEVIREEQMNYLRKVYGPNIPDPTDVYIARFYQDPLFLQAWGDWDQYTSPDICDQIKAPILNQEEQQNIYLSGEATCCRYRGFTHGGFLAGKRDALAVLVALGYDVNTDYDISCENQEAGTGGAPYGKGR